MRAYIFLLLFFIGTTLSVAQPCQLTAPIAGSSWTVGATMPIQWLTTAFTTNVNLTLIDYTSGGSGTVVLAIAGNIPNSGTFNWVIPTTLSPKCVYGVYVENVGRTNWCYGPADICLRSVPLCCPEFSLALYEPCRQQGDPECISPNFTGVAPIDKSIRACKNQAHTYLVTPNDPNFTYSWTITGGTPTTFTGNPAIITWGNGSQGTLQVIMVSKDSLCRDTIKRTVCLIDGPIANFTFSPNPVCLNGTVCFNNTPSVGANSFYWDFGDGTSSTLPNPCHTYSPSGNYTVVLTVSSAQSPDAKDCGCKDTAQAVVNVSGLSGIDIHTDDCRKMLCSGDTVTYCTSTVGCTGLNWVVNGGTILSGQGSTCILVAWNLPSTYPTSVTLNATCPSTCGNSATLNVPVLYPNLPIQGLTTVCPNTTTTYSLPALPGTFYNWSINNSAGIISPIDKNHNAITVNWGSVQGGPYIITCNYFNPFSGCRGTSTISVFIRPKFQMTGLSPVCANTNATYSVFGVPLANWNWNISPISTTAYTPSGTPTGTFSNLPNLPITWNTAGNYTVTATPLIATNYCNTSSAFNVTVNPNPVLNPIIGDAVVCLNQVYTYSVTSSVSGGNYSWLFTSGTGTIAPYGANNSLASIIFTGTVPWTIEVTQTANGCSGKRTLSITKVPVPPAITLSANSVCSGSPVTASVTGVVPFGGYTWSCSPGGVLTGGQGTTSATFTINSNATITLSSCGGTVSTNVTTTVGTVTVSQSPTPCGATLTATGTPSGGTYTWFLSGTSVGTSNSLGVSQNGNYVVQYANGTCVATASIPVIGITPVVTTISGTGDVCPGNTATLVATIPANCPSPVFKWYKVGVVASVGSGPTFTATTAGCYYVIVTCSNGCSDTSNILCAGCNGCVNPPCTPPPPCIPDLVISPSNCPNPVNLTTNVPAGCTSPVTSWNYGDLTYGTGSIGTHQYTNVGIYTVQAVMDCNGTLHCGKVNVTVPMVDSFTSVVTCGVNSWVILLQDASIFLPTYSGYTMAWSVSPACATFTTATNIANPSLSVPFGCNPTVTLTISKNGCTLTKSFTFSFPTTPLAILGPPPPVICRGGSYLFSSSFNTALTYAWNFGDATTGVTNPITHVYNGTPSNPTITLTVKDNFGCTFTANKPVTVTIPTPLTIIPSPIVRICPDCSPPTVLNTNPSVGFTGYQWYQNGAIITPGGTGSTYPLCNFNASGNYYVTATNNGCPVKSDIVQVVYKPKPVADIVGQSAQCVSSTAPYFINLQNNETSANPAYTYNWTGTGAGAVIFTPDATHFSTSAQVSVIGTYQFILTVTDISTGCVAKDTLCVTLYPNPTVTIAVVPSGSSCAGINYTFTANPLPAPSAVNNYMYLWSTMATTQSITTGQPGFYSVGVINTATGCSATASSITIKRQPYLDLFPIGCDTLCDTARIIPPLPLGISQTTYTGVYLIQWYETGASVPFFTGSPLLASSLTLGQHHIYIIVTDLATGCKDTSGVYDLFIRNCSDCCPYTIKTDSIHVRYDTIALPTATVLVGTFNVSGLSTADITEVRANVVSYTISDNYGTECMKCQNFPFTWASVAIASPIRTIPPKITMYGGTTVPYFTGVGAGKYQNPREIIWNNGSTFSIPNNTPVSLAFLLPHVPIIDCCELKGSVCVKLTFRDSDCKECEVIVCFPFVIKKNMLLPLSGGSSQALSKGLSNGFMQK
jgi:PKD repeat protein